MKNLIWKKETPPNNDGYFKQPQIHNLLSEIQKLLKMTPPHTHTQHTPFFITPPHWELYSPLLLFHDNRVSPLLPASFRLVHAVLPAHVLGPQSGARM